MGRERERIERLRALEREEREREQRGDVALGEGAFWRPRMPTLDELDRVAPDDAGWTEVDRG